MSSRKKLKRMAANAQVAAGEAAGAGVAVSPAQPAPSQIVLIEGAMPAGLARLGELVEHVPAYWVELGRDFWSTPNCMRELISDVK